MNVQKSTSLFCSMDYHSLLPTQTLIFPKEVTLNQDQSEVINDAIKDIRIKMCVTYREQYYILINLLHSIDTDKVIVPYDVIGKMFYATSRSWINYQRVFKIWNNQSSTT